MRLWKAAELITSNNWRERKSTEEGRKNTENQREVETKDPHSYSCTIIDFILISSYFVLAFILVYICSITCIIYSISVFSHSLIKYLGINKIVFNF